MWSVVSVCGMPIEWAPLLKVGSSEVEIGISRQGMWYIGDADDCLPINSTTVSVRTLPLLELEVSEFKRRVSEMLIKVQIPLDQIDGGLELPLRTSVNTALSGLSEYWIALALERLQLLKLFPETAQLLSVLAESTQASQHVRHKAKRLLRLALKQ
jgi:hypothetical protein